MNPGTTIPFSTSRREAMVAALTGLEHVKAPLIMEVGRTRDVVGAEGDGFSTVHFGAFVSSHGGHLLSIDADPDTKHECRILLNIVGVNLAAITFIDVEQGAFQIPSFDKAVNLLLLDGPDCYPGLAEGSAQWHAECARFLEGKVAAGGFVLVDDCLSADVPAGKGKYCVPWLVKQGYEVRVKGYMWLLQKGSKA